MLSSVRRGTWGLARQAALAASRTASRETGEGGMVALRLLDAQDKEGSWRNAAALLVAGTGLLASLGAVDVAHNEAAAAAAAAAAAKVRGTAERGCKEEMDAIWLTLFPLYPTRQEEPAAAVAADAGAAAATTPARPGKAVKTSGMKLFSGNANPKLAAEIAGQLGMNLGKITVSRFADGEVNVMVHENVRGKDVYIVQPTCSPVNESLMELLLMVSTMRRSSARRITAVIPYYGYARQDRKMQARVPISAADVARLLEAMGVDRVVAVDLHCGQIQGFFGPRVPVDNLDGGTVGVSYFGDKDLHNPVIVSPDAGGVYRAKKFREGMAQKYDVDAGLAMIIKQRARANEVDRMDLVGSVMDSDVVIVDDMIDVRSSPCFPPPAFMSLPPPLHPTPLTHSPQNRPPARWPKPRTSWLPTAPAACTRLLPTASFPARPTSASSSPSWRRWWSSTPSL